MQHDAAKEELTFIMRTVGCKNNQHINRAQLSQAIESSSTEDLDIYLVSSNNIKQPLNTGVGKCPMTREYWTSPKIVAMIDHIHNGWVM